MNSPARLEFPLNDPKLISPLEEFRQVIRELTANRDDLNITDLSDEDHNFMHAGKHSEAAPDGQTSISETLTVTLQVPTPKSQASGFATPTLVSGLSASTKISNRNGVRETVTRGKTLSIRFEPITKKPLIYLVLNTKDLAERFVESEGRWSRPKKPTESEEVLGNISDLTQRLEFIKLLVGRALNPEE